MGTREVYEEKLSFGNLYHDPTMNPGLGLPRCHRCLSLLNPNADNGEWTITSVLHDATVVISYLILIYMYECNYVPCFLVFMTLQWLDLLGRIAHPLSKLGCYVDDVFSRCTLRNQPKSILLWSFHWNSSLPLAHFCTDQAMLALELAECLVQFMVSIQGSCISKNMLKDQMASFTYWGVDYVLCTSGVPLFLFCLLLRPQSANPCASCRKVLYTIPSESEIDLQGLVAKEKLN
ncbi:hypothetical protein TEA_027684 [Camellia sinensis var. sinensis]|uniref:Uncharacterized protein n=1 Tax=Camellia sinensis var. sinensis TaxID=542762 RepID=A0A4S4EYB5_CAMSN|nr:hypothetical protein TEA_027684 [Camellia sinensis var. sinensis]